MPVDRGVVACFAPGGGLGHLNRTLALCLGLRDNGVDARIVTDSPFAPGIAALARMPVVQLDRSDWANSARAYVDETRPRAIVTDTFPYGLREEWRQFPPPVPLIHVARRLLTPFPIEPARFALILQAEPLAEDHAASLGPSVRLPGPIVLHPGAIPTPIPPSLAVAGQTLVVHSGPADELAVLTGAAEPPFTVISPWSGVDYFPACNLYARARHIVTGAGYNSMAGLLACRDRHTAIPFPRRYDDQHARVKHFFRQPADGTPHAVQAILAALTSARVS